MAMAIGRWQAMATATAVAKYQTKYFPSSILRANLSEEVELKHPKQVRRPSVNFEMSFLYIQFSQKANKKNRLYYFGTSSRIVVISFWEN